MNLNESETDESYKPGSESEAQFTDSASESEAEFTDSASESEAEFTDGEEEAASAKKRKAKTSKGAKPAKKEKKEKRSRFLDVEAVVGDEDEEEEEDDDLLDDDFIADEDEAEEAATVAAEIREARLRREQMAKSEEFDAEAEERRLKALYGRVRDSQAIKKAAALEAVLPKPFLLPTVTDPKLWLCKAQQGRERSAALAMLRVIMERQYSGQPLPIFSVIARDGLKGYVYIEAHKPSQVAQAIEIAKLGHCLYPGQAGKSLVLVPLAEMPQVLQTTAATGGSAAKAAEIPEIGEWVRIKRGKYANDLAQVVDNVQDEGSYDPSNLNTCIIRVKLVPRLAFTSAGSEDKSERPPPRSFDPEEASRYGPVSKSRGFWIYGGETYKDGMLFKNMRLSSLITGKVGPTVEELARFPDAKEGERGVGAFDTEDSATAASGIQIALVPGDRVVITEGEMKNLRAVVDSLETRPNATTGQMEQVALVIADENSGLVGDAAKLTVRTSNLRKTFRVGEHLTVISGPRAGESGVVVSEQASGTRRNPLTVLVLFSAINNEQFSVNAAYCVRAEQKANLAGGEDLDSSSVKPTSGRKEATAPEVSLDDFVSFQGISGEEGVGVVVRILDAENSLVLFDSLGQLRTVPGKNTQLLASAPLPNRSVVDDSRTISQGDRVSDSTGSFFKVLHLYKSLAFLRPLTAGVSGGVCVQPLGNISKPMASSSSSGGSGASFAAFSGRSLLNKTVTIVGGPHKGYVGFVKQINDGIARVELHTNSKVISVPADKLMLSEKDSSARRSAVPAYASSSAAAGWGAVGGTARTPAWNAGSAARTPAWNSGSARTPAWNAGSARTPAWNSASATTPGIQPGRTPAWSAATGMTPAWNSNAAASSSSARTPAWAASSAKTPTWATSSSYYGSSGNQKKRDDVSEWDQVNDWKRDE